jgi:hypothetical protein
VRCTLPASLRVGVTSRRLSVSGPMSGPVTPRVVSAIRHARGSPGSGPGLLGVSPRGRCGQRVSLCAVCCRHQRQNLFSSSRSLVFDLFFVVT